MHCCRSVRLLRIWDGARGMLAGFKARARRRGVRGFGIGRLVAGLVMLAVAAAMVGPAAAPTLAAGRSAAPPGFPEVDWPLWPDWSIWNLDTDWTAKNIAFNTDTPSSATGALPRE